ncbi:MAG: prepilin-type N-terminal cleavage/methylation domain-containing protein [Sulfurimonas sp.]|uniref:type II secretion system protein n=1 Tax=Sulfurimonas sp. TaxID=2022749 RepID=UPI00261217A9|nr:prepilin-type N-terminal cleavage/methylation domain-containing protein [Sulfurimonas sp.]MDD5373555.1 prepilin-type N-terminal cleavage/methylation domain-containing protein [Sulfurimonas sp.]
MGRRGFTLIELAIALTIIGLMIGGSFKAMRSMSERSRISEAKEQVLGAKNAVMGYAIEYPSLPSVAVFDQNLSPLKGNQADLIMYVPANNLITGDDICAFTTTNLSVTVNNVDGSARPPITNVAFVIAHGSANRNIQTALVGNNIVVHSPSEQNIDDNTTSVNRPEQYDDIVEWMTLTQLQKEVGCIDRPLRFLEDKLPNAKVGVAYPDLSVSSEVKLMVENNISAVTINCNPTSQKGINFVSPNFSGTPTAAGTAAFSCTATEGLPSSRPPITKDFVISIDPYLNKAKDLNCTLDSECASGICVGGICRSGVATDPCIDGGDCQSGLCIGGVCQAGAVTNRCNSGNDCISGFCAGGVCTTGAFGVACDNDGGDCKSGICYNNICSGAIGYSCSSNSHCLSGYCDSNTSVCAITPAGGGGSGGGGSGGGGGGGGGVAPSCSLASSPSVINANGTAALNYTINNGPVSGTFTPASGGCSSFSNSTGGSCTTASLARNTLFALSVTNAYGGGSCNTKVCVARTEYRIYNDTGARQDFMVDGSCRRVNNGSEITTVANRLNSGESITIYSSSNGRCTTAAASITFNQAACADDDADGLVNFSGADR